MTGIDPTGGGMGKTSGTPFPTQTILEDKTSAFKRVYHDVLGIVPQVKEYDVFLPHRFRVGLRDYPTVASRPTLAHMQSIRESRLYEMVEDERTPALHAQLLNFLPPDVKTLILNERKKVFAQRDPALVALDNLLAVTARGMAWLEIASDPTAFTSTDRAYAEINQALPYVFFASMTERSTDTHKQAQAFLQQVGPNYPHYDTLLNFTNDLGKINGQLDQVYQQLNAGNGDILKSAQFQSLIQDISRLDDQLGRVDSGPNLQMIKTHVTLLHRTVQALSLKVASPAQYLGLENVHPEELIGSHVQTALNAVTEGLVNSLELTDDAELVSLHHLQNNLKTRLEESREGNPVDLDEYPAIQAQLEAHRLTP